MQSGEADIMGGPLPGGGRYRILVEGEFGPEQICALIAMLKVTAECLDDDDAIPTGRAALAASSTQGEPDADHA